MHRSHGETQKSCRLLAEEERKREGGESRLYLEVRR
jgi:hypothetical protein